MIWVHSQVAAYVPAVSLHLRPFGAFFLPELTNLPPCIIKPVADQRVISLGNQVFDPVLLYSANPPAATRVKASTRLSISLWARLAM